MKYQPGLKNSTTQKTKAYRRYAQLERLISGWLYYSYFKKNDSAIRKRRIRIPLWHLETE